MSHNARHNARTMYEQDACAQAMGMDIIDMDEGYAVVTMTITRRCLTAIKPATADSSSRLPTPRLPTPATAEGWRRWPLAAQSISFDRVLSETS